MAEEAAHIQHGGIREQALLTVEKIIVTFIKIKNSWGKKTTQISPSQCGSVG